MNSNASNIVCLSGQHAFTTSLIVAEGCPVERRDRLTGLTAEFPRDHRDVIKLIRTYQADFEELGLVRFQTALISSAGRGSPTEYAVLNEDQATYLVTLFNNTAVVRKFKLLLVKEFRQALNQIAKDFANPPRQGMLATKRSNHWDMTDALLECRTDAGKDTNAKHYMCENKLCNWAVTGKFQAIDEASLSNEDVVLLGKVRIQNAAMLKLEMDYTERKPLLLKFAMKHRTKLLSH